MKNFPKTKYQTCKFKYYFIIWGLSLHSRSYFSRNRDVCYLTHDLCPTEIIIANLNSHSQ